jgi:serine/threonine protein kinase
MEKYKISKNVEISSLDEASFGDAPPQYHAGYFVLYHAGLQRSFLINETVHYFISKFNAPKSQAEVIAEIKEELKADDQELEQTCSAFFEFLRKRKILVSESKEELTVPLACFYREGESINVWRITDILSNKKSVDIYRAYKANSEETCVIKLLNRDKVGDQHKYEKEVLRLEREYLLLRKASDIAAVSRAFSFERDEHQNAYLVLESITGEGLWRYLDSREILTLPECLQLIESMLEAFSGLHQHNLIHGDIHPSNLMVADEKTVRIIDLGLSRNVDTEKSEVVKFGGVDYYMPPERINISSVKKHSKEPDLRSDVYQIGLMVYLILYNSIPFNGFIWEELAEDIKRGTSDYGERTFWNEAVPLSLVAIIRKSINVEPNERYPDATSFLREFRKACLQQSHS